MDVAKAELDVYMKEQNTEKNKLEETRRKLEESTKQADEKER